MSSRSQRKKKAQQTRPRPSAEVQPRAPEPAADQQQPQPHGQAVEPQVISMEAGWSGPLPPPQALEAFDRVVPGGAERIVAMAESQSSHRQAMERLFVETQTKTEKRGQLMAFGLALTAILVGGFLVYTDHDGAGFATIIAAIAGLVGVNVFSRILERRELGERREEDKQLQIEFPEDDL